MEENRFLFEDDTVWHALAVMALPAIASQLITLVYNLADTWFGGILLIGASGLYAYYRSFEHLRGRWGNPDYSFDWPERR